MTTITLCLMSAILGALVGIYFTFQCFEERLDANTKLALEMWLTTEEVQEILQQLVFWVVVDRHNKPIHGRFGTLHASYLIAIMSATNELDRMRAYAAFSRMQKEGWRVIRLVEKPS